VEPIRLCALVVSLAASGCITSPSPVDVLGLWGGSHLSMQVTSVGGRLQYDCADGVIEEPIRPNAAGRFTAVGSHTPSHGGPIRVDEILPAFRARYDGEVDGERMNLAVTLVDTGVVLGSFQLLHGSSGLLVRCL
jgi:hypothetical protein